MSLQSASRPPRIGVLDTDQRLGYRRGSFAQAAIGRLGCGFRFIDPLTFRAFASPGHLRFTDREGLISIGALAPPSFPLFGPQATFGWQCLLVLDLLAIGGVRSLEDPFAFRRMLDRADSLVGVAAADLPVIPSRLVTRSRLSALLAELPAEEFFLLKRSRGGRGQGIVRWPEAGPESLEPEAAEFVIVQPEMTFARVARLSLADGALLFARETLWHRSEEAIAPYQKDDQWREQPIEADAAMIELAARALRALGARSGSVEIGYAADRWWFIDLDESVSNGPLVSSGGHLFAAEHLIKLALASQNPLTSPARPDFPAGPIGIPYPRNPARQGGPDLLLAAAARHGFTVSSYDPSEIMVRVDERGVSVRLAGRSVPFTVTAPIQPLVEWPTRYATVRLFEAAGIGMLDGYEQCERADDKRLTAAILARAHVESPRSEILPIGDFRPRSAWASEGFVLKYPFGGHGRLVRRVAPGAGAAAAADLYAAAAAGPARNLLAQEYLPAGHTIYRVVVLNGSIIWAAQEMARSDDWRTNGPTGGSSTRVDHRTLGAIGKTATAAMAAVGLCYGSVDLTEDRMGRPSVLEVNAAAGIADADMAEALMVGLAQLAGQA